MKHLTYSDTTIINYIVANFIPIRIELQMPDNGLLFRMKGKKSLLIIYWMLSLELRIIRKRCFAESDGNKIRSIIGDVKPNVFLYILKYFNGSDYKKQRHQYVFKGKWDQRTNQMIPKNIACRLTSRSS